MPQALRASVLFLESFCGNTIGPDLTAPSWSRLGNVFIFLSRARKQAVVRDYCHNLLR
jgi:hypothetical protein